MSSAAPLVLLVEDDANDARLVQRAFTRISVPVSVVRVPNGDEAVSYLRGEAPGAQGALHAVPLVVLLDIKLPRRSGFEVLQWVRAQAEPLKRLPIVMLTSSTESADINRAYDLGANSYLAKPPSTEKLNELVRMFAGYWLEANRAPALA
jgi:CheY-like chemotaxis protein